jgi:hypothetical protein
MTDYISVIFCRRCSSRNVEISEWEEGKAIFHCRSCNNKEILSGFTLGRCQVKRKDIQEARDTIAKHGDYEK